jgi:hypothetical protein
MHFNSNNGFIRHKKISIHRQTELIQRIHFPFATHSIPASFQGLPNRTGNFIDQLSTSTHDFFDRVRGTIF